MVDTSKRPSACIEFTLRRTVSIPVLNPEALGGEEALLIVSIERLLQMLVNGVQFCVRFLPSCRETVHQIHCDDHVRAGRIFVVYVLRMGQEIRASQR